MKRLILCSAALTAALWVLPAAADTVDARCDIFPAGSDQLQAMLPCTFSQRQGFIRITRDDGVTHDLTPDGSTAGNFTDQDGRAVYRQSGMGDQGLIFRFPDISIFVYWSTAGLGQSGEAAPTNVPTNAQYPIFAAQCAGGVNAGGYNIDTDTEGHLWINGHSVVLESVGEDMWEGAYHGVVFDITSTENELIVSYTGRHGVNGICTVTAM